MIWGACRHVGLIGQNEKAAILICQIEEGKKGEGTFSHDRRCGEERRRSLFFSLFGFRIFARFDDHHELQRKLHSWQLIDAHPAQFFMAACISSGVMSLRRVANDHLWP
jgi:hypothetical protein